LEELVDLDALADKRALPRLLVSATDLKDGQIEYFYSDSRDYNLTLDHIIASGSLPPAFPSINRVPVILISFRNRFLALARL
jgi:NTE family protein